MLKHNYIIIHYFFKYHIFFFFFFKALQEISVEERKRTLENNKMEVQTVQKKLEALNADIKIDDKRVQEAVRKVLWFIIF